MGKNLEPNKLAQLAEMVKVENTMKNPHMNPIMNGKPFIREGKAGAWKGYFKNAETLADWDLWIKRNVDELGIKEKFFDE